MLLQHVAQVTIHFYSACRLSNPCVAVLQLSTSQGVYLMLIPFANDNLHVTVTNSQVYLLWFGVHYVLKGCMDLFLNTSLKFLPIKCILEFHTIKEE